MIVSAELASSAVSFFDRAFEAHGSRLASPTLDKVGLSRDRVRAMLDESRPLTPEEVRRASVRAIKKGSVGRGGLPRYVVDAIYADYQRLHSCAKVAKIYGRTRQSIWEILRSHKRMMDDRTANFRPVLEYNGRRYTILECENHRYYRETSGERRLLHRQIWEDAHGPVPRGHEISFADRDPLNFSIENLVCRPRTAASRVRKAS